MPCGGTPFFAAASRLRRPTPLAGSQQPLSLPGGLPVHRMILQTPQLARCNLLFAARRLIDQFVDRVPL